MREDVKKLYRTSYQLRQKALEMVYNARTGHCAPCLSMAEIITVLYFDELNLRPEDPQWADRDRMVLSKGHASPLYYAALAKRGFFPEEELSEYRQLNSKLQGHPDMRKCPGVDMTSGSLGNGVSAALGMALIGKKDKKDYYVYAVSGDGELQEGIVWEAAIYAGNAKLDNLIMLVDYNRLQSGGSVEEIQNLDDLEKKFEAFGWDTQSIDGHDIEAIQQAIATAKARKGTPSVILCNTIKGKGISYMEGEYLWHMKAPNDAEFAQGMKELSEEVKRYE